MKGGTCFRLAALLAMAVCIPAYGQGVGDPLTPLQKDFCKTHPQECKERDARQKAWCKSHPEQCKDLKARRETLRKRCASNQATCVRTQEGRQQRFQEYQAKCAANPADCERKKTEARKYFKHRREKCEADPVACEKEAEARRARIYNREKTAQTPAKEPEAGNEMQGPIAD